MTRILDERPTSVHLKMPFTVRSQRCLFGLASPSTQSKVRALAVRIRPFSSGPQLD